jgi:hypothetical protein
MGDPKSTFQSLKRYKVIWPFKPLRSDEIPLDAGDDVLVAKEYEDGWMRGIKLDTREVGFFPSNYVQPKKSPIYSYQRQSGIMRIENIDTKFAENDPNRRAKVFLEMYLTEKVYNDRLNTLHNFFVVPLGGFSVLDPEDYSIVFSRILPVLNLSSEVVGLMESRVEAWQDPTTLIGDLFLYKGREMEDLFTSYAAKHVIGQKVLERISSKNKVHLSKIEQECGRTLNSLMIEPVQRITRYLFLLKDLLHSTHRGHPDYPHLEAAVALVSDINKECDECTKRMQSELALLLITKQFPNDDVNLVRIKPKKGKSLKQLSRQVMEVVENHPQPEIAFENKTAYHAFFQSECRELVREGDILRGKNGFSGTSERHLFLLTDLLLVAQSSGAKKKRFSLKDRIPLVQAWITDQFFDGNKIPEGSFVVGSPNEVHYFVSTDSSSKLVWFEEIRKLIFNQKKMFNKFLTHLTVPDEVYYYVKVKVVLPYLAMGDSELTLSRDDEAHVIGHMSNGKWTSGLYPLEEMLDPSEEWYFGFTAQSFGWFPKGCVKLVRPSEGSSEPPMLPAVRTFMIRKWMQKICGIPPLAPTDQERHVKVKVAEGHVKTLPIDNSTTVMDVVRRFYPNTGEGLQWLLYERSNDGTVNRGISSNEDLCVLVDFWGKLKGHMHLHLQQGNLINAPQGHSDA